MTLPKRLQERLESAMQEKAEEVAEILGTLPDSFPCFNANITPMQANPIGPEGSNVGYLGQVKNAFLTPPDRKELPDQVVIWRPLEDGTGHFRVSVSRVMFHLTKDGYLCCRAIEGDLERSFILFAEQKGQIGDGEDTLSYLEICTAVKKRNELWQLEAPLELRDLYGEQFKSKTKEKIEPRFPSNDAITALPNLGADRDVHRSLMTYPHQWLINENLCLRAFDGRENTVVYQPSEVVDLLQDAPEKALVLLEKRFGEIKNETVPDVIDILFHHWHRHRDPDTNASIITAAQLCKYRNKGTKGDNLDLHWHALQDAFSMSLRERTGNINAKVFFAETVGEKMGAGAAYIYSPGFMLQYALRGETLYFAPFMQKIWELDPVRHNEAKRIARYIRGDWRMNTEKYLTAENGKARTARYHTWSHILSESGINVETHRNSPNPGRLIKAVEKAVETLYQMEVLEGSGLDVYHPDDRRIAEKLPRSGALDTWLSLRVCLAPAADVRQALIETDTKRRAGRARDAAALSQERAKRSLKAKTKPKKG